MGKWRGANPVEQVARRKLTKPPPPPVLRVEEVPAFLQAAEPEWRPLLAAAIWTGMRKGELLGLRKRDLDFNERTITVARSYGADTTKGGHADVLPMPHELVRTFGTRSPGLRPSWCSRTDRGGCTARTWI